MELKAIFALVAATATFACQAETQIYNWATIAGTAGSAGSTDGTNRAARFNGPSGVAVDGTGNVYVADRGNSTIRKLTPAGTNWLVSTIAGLAGSAGSTDGTNKAARFNGPSGVAVDSAGNAYVADRGNNTIRKLTPVGTNWVASTIAGMAGSWGSTDGYGSNARFNDPSGIAVSFQGYVYVADRGNSTIRMLQTWPGSDWYVTTIAGQAGYTGSADGTNSAARFDHPAGVANYYGNVYVADTLNATIRSTIQKSTGPWEVGWAVDTIAGIARNYGLWDGFGTGAMFEKPEGLAVGVTEDGYYNLYVADTGNQAIRKLTPSGTNLIVTTIGGAADSVGNPVAGSADGTNRAAGFNGPSGAAVDSAGNVYVADTLNNTIRMGVPSAVPPLPSPVLFSFDYVDSGNEPSGLVQGTDGNFYGTTGYGGWGGGGTVFRITTNGTFTILWGFEDGYQPFGSLVQRKYDGNFYGTTRYGGAYGKGTAFTSSTPMRPGYFDFLASFDGTNGSSPNGALVEGVDGNFYGTTMKGGTNGGWGTIYKMTFNGRITSLHSLANGDEGADPQTGLVLGADGNFYGTTTGGGPNNAGTIFRFNPNGALTTLYSFTGGDDGYYPNGLVQGPDGSFYGTTEAGGTYWPQYGGAGTVFRITTGGTLATLISFNGTNGANPQTPLLQGSDGALYGTTLDGGTANYGTVFRMTTNGTLTTLFSFNAANGWFPQTALVQGTDGCLYGTMLYGGAYGYLLGVPHSDGGTIFRLSLTPPPFAFQPVRQTAGAIMLTWSATAGRRYQIQFKANLTQTNWINLGSVITATNDTAAASDVLAVGPSQRFYRAVLLP